MLLEVTEVRVIPRTVDPVCSPNLGRQHSEATSVDTIPHDMTRAGIVNLGHIFFEVTMANVHRDVTLETDHQDATSMEVTDHRDATLTDATIPYDVGLAAETIPKTRLQQWRPFAPMQRGSPA